MTPIEDIKLQQMIDRKELSKDRIELYKIVFNDYCRLTQKTPSELISEAREDQEPYLGKNNRILFTPKSERKLALYINQYYKYLKTKDLSEYSMDTYLKSVYAFYNEFDIELPKKINVKLPKVIIRKGDLPTIKDIRLAVDSTKELRNKAMILLFLTSGMRRGAIVNLRVSDFIEATKEYHNGDDIKTVLGIEDTSNIIPNWLFFPSKTEEYSNICLTFNTPECTEYILNYLKTRKDLKESDSLFNLTGSGMSTVFRELNDRLFGKTKHSNKRLFMPHRLRKLFLTTFRKKTNDLFSLRLVAGHSLPTKIDDNYQEIPIEETKEEYMKVIPFLSIRDTKVHNIKSEEYIKLEMKNIELEEKDKAKEEEIKSMGERLDDMEERLRRAQWANYNVPKE